VNESGGARQEFEVGSAAMGQKLIHCAANTVLNRTVSWSLQSHEHRKFDLTKLKVDGAEIVMQLAELLMQTCRKGRW
jgi:hypothetical protein